MELWQVDIVGGVMLADGTEAKVVTGVDDHLRYCVIAAGYHLAGQRITARLDHGVLHILDTDRTVLRSLPHPLTPDELTRIRGARPAGPPPAPAAEPVRVQRRVSCRGSLMIAGQRIHVGIHHAGRTLTVEDADTTWRIFHGTDQLLEVARTSAKPIARFEARKPEPPRQRAGTTTRHPGQA